MYVFKIAFVQYQQFQMDVCMSNWDAFGIIACTSSMWTVCSNVKISSKYPAQSSLSALLHTDTTHFVKKICVTRFRLEVNRAIYLHGRIQINFALAFQNSEKN